jgi:hypothetical protein
MQCAKQTEGSLLCGYYACEYLRACGRFSHSWRQLKKSLGWWQKENVDKKSITRIVANICKFVMYECCEVGGNFFYMGSKLAIDPKFEMLCNWRTSGIDMNDYTLSNIFE